MQLTVYVFGENKPVFTGDVTVIPGAGERVLLGDLPYAVESVAWKLKAGVLEAFVYLTRSNMDSFR